MSLNKEDVFTKCLKGKPTKCSKKGEINQQKLPQKKPLKSRSGGKLNKGPQSAHYLLDSYKQKIY